MEDLGRLDYVDQLLRDGRYLPKDLRHLLPHLPLRLHYKHILRLRIDIHLLHRLLRHTTLIRGDMVCRCGYHPEAGQRCDADDCHRYGNNGCSLDSKHPRALAWTVGANHYCYIHRSLWKRNTDLDDEGFSGEEATRLHLQVIRVLSSYQY